MWQKQKAIGIYRALGSSTSSASDFKILTKDIHLFFSYMEYEHSSKLHLASFQFCQCVTLWYLELQGKFNMLCVTDYYSIILISWNLNIQRWQIYFPKCIRLLEWLYMCSTQIKSRSMLFLIVFLISKSL